MDEVDNINVKEEPELLQRKVSEKYPGKDTSSTCPDIVLPPKLMLDEEELTGLAQKSVLQGYSKSQSLPIPIKLVSAMKGSRAERGRISGKLSVKWASDVYDPPQTSLSHTVNSKRQKKKPKNKKNGKKAQNQNNNNRRQKGGANKTQMNNYSASRIALVSC